MACPFSIKSKGDSMRRVYSSCLIAFSLFTGLSLMNLPALAETTIAVPDTAVKPVSAPATSASRPKVGLALGGGGTRGAAHVEVLKVLEKEGIPIDFIAGTSMGSVVGGLYAAGVPLDELEKEFQNGSLMHSFMTVPLWIRVVAAPIMVTPRLFGSKAYDGLYKGNKFRKFLTKGVAPAEQNIEDLKIPYAAVAVSLIDGKTHLLNKGNLGYAMQASCAVPGLRKPVQIGDDLFCDGGVVSNVPVDECRKMGADIVIAVCVDERFNAEPLAHFRKIGSVSDRLIKLQLHDNAQPRTARADLVIHPNVDGVSLISTKKDDAKKALKAGREAAMAAIPEIRKKLAEAGLQVAGKISTP